MSVAGPVVQGVPEIGADKASGPSLERSAKAAYRRSLLVVTALCSGRKALEAAARRDVAKRQVGAGNGPCRARLTPRKLPPRRGALMGAHELKLTDAALSANVRTSGTGKSGRFRRKDFVIGFWHMDERRCLQSYRSTVYVKTISVSA